MALIPSMARADLGCSHIDEEHPTVGRDQNGPRMNMRGNAQAFAKPAEPPRHPVWIDIAVGLVAGLAATQVTNLAQKPLKRVTPDNVDRHEKRVRPGASSSLVAAQKITKMLDLPHSQRKEELLGSTIHFATGVSWGPVYGLLRRYAGLQPLGAALATGGAMSLILDETLVPALGLSAPNQHYPTFTRIRGLVAHLVYGTAVAFAAEGLERLVKRPPGRR